MVSSLLRSTSFRVLMCFALAACIGSFTAQPLFSSFSSVTVNPANTYQAASLSLSEDHPASGMFSLAGLLPAEPHQRCLIVAADVDVPVDLRLHATSSGALVPYLDLQVEVGTLDPDPPGHGCTGFVATQTIFDGPLADLPSSWPTGIDDPASPLVDGDTSAYRFTIEMDSNVAAASKSAELIASWEARAS